MNENGVPDECEGLLDWDENGIADICEGLVAYNVDQGVGYTTFSDATHAANENDYIWIRGDANQQLNYWGKSLTCYVADGNDADIPALVLADGAWFPLEPDRGPEQGEN